MRSSIEMKIIKKNQPEILELKNTMHEIKIQKIASTSDTSKQEEEKKSENSKTEGLNG